MNIRKIAKRENGVTLIVLVVTIIVLLILAGVSINMITGQEGILKKLEDTKTKNEIAKEQETIELAALAARVDTKEGIKVISKENLKNELDKVIGTNKYELSENPINDEDEKGEYFLVTYNESRRSYKVYIETGKVEILDNRIPKIEEILDNENNPSDTEEIIDDENNTENEEVTEENAVASAIQNDETKYFNTLQGAINSIQTTGRVVLKEDITVDSPVEIVGGKTIEFDTNGKEISSLTCNTILNGGILTVIGTGTIKNTDDTQYYAISNWGTLYANSGTIYGVNGGILNRGTVNVNGATILSNYIGIKNIAGYSSIIKMTSGKVEVNNDGDKQLASIRADEGTITMTGGELYAKSNKGTAYGILARNTVTTKENVTIEVAGGTIKGESVESWRLWNWFNRRRRNTFKEFAKYKKCS